MKKLLLLSLFFIPGLLKAAPVKYVQISSNVTNGIGDLQAGTTGGFYILGQGLSKGTTINDNAPVGYVGEYFSTTAVVSVLAAASNNFDDILSTTVGPGDWMIGGGARFDRNTATWSGCAIAVSTNSGNDSTTLIPSVNDTQGTWASSSSTPADMTLNTPIWRWSSNTSTTIYLKRQFTYTVNTPRTREQNLWVRRMR